MISFLSLYAADNSPGILRTFFSPYKNNSYRSPDQPMCGDTRTIADVSHNSAGDVGCSEERSPGTIVFPRREDLDHRDSCLSRTRTNCVPSRPLLLVLKAQSASVALHPDIRYLYFNRLEDPISLPTQRLPFLPPHLLENVEPWSTLDHVHSRCKSQYCSD